MPRVRKRSAVCKLLLRRNLKSFQGTVVINRKQKRLGTRRRLHRSGVQCITPGDGWKACLWERVVSLIPAGGAGSSLQEVHNAWREDPKEIGAQAAISPRQTSSESGTEKSPAPRPKKAGGTQPPPLYIYARPPGAGGGKRERE